MIAELAARVVNPWKWVAIGLAAALATSVGWALLEKSTAAGLRASLAAEKQERAEEHAAAERAAREAENAIREAERRHAVEQQRIVTELGKAKDETAAALAASQRDADSLRDAITCYASGDCLGAKSPATAGGDCRNRAGTLGKLFREADGLAERLAQDVERRNAEVRALKRQIEADRSACTGTNKSD